MLAVQVELLTGRYAATRHDDRHRVEWPPHPARLYSAMVAAWADSDSPDPGERAALEWIEAQDPPVVHVSQASERDPVTHYVPVNDVSVARRDLSPSYRQLKEATEPRAAPARPPASERALAKAGADAHDRSRRAFASGNDSTSEAEAVLSVLPERRAKQGRTYPVAVPDVPSVLFTWPRATPPHDVLTRLDLILGRVGRLGHSSSFVSCWASTEAVVPEGLLARTPGLGSVDSISLRVPAAGLLDVLEEEHTHHQGREPRVLTSVSVSYTGGRSRPHIPRSDLAGVWLPLAVARGRVQVAAGVALARAVRGALMHHGPQPAPPLLSGHRAGPVPSEPSDRSHLLVVPLPYVGSRYSDGSVKAVALVLPEQLADELDVVQRAVDSWIAENGARVWSTGDAVALARVDDRHAPSTARADRWARAAARWTSVTPIALDRVPRHWQRRRKVEDPSVYAEAGEVIAGSCVALGLPSPVAVTVRFDSTATGVPPVQRFPLYESSPGGPRRVSVHAEVTFAEPVEGPLVVGAGRYHGAGLLLPLRKDEP